MSNIPDKPSDKANWTGAASIAGAAIGSAALVAALLYASRRKERAEARANPAPLSADNAPETD